MLQVHNRCSSPIYAWSNLTSRNICQNVDHLCGYTKGKIGDTKKLVLDDWVGCAKLWVFITAQRMGQACDGPKIPRFVTTERSSDVRFPRKSRCISHAWPELWGLLLLEMNSVVSKLAVTNYRNATTSSVYVLGSLLGRIAHFHTPINSHHPHTGKRRAGTTGDGFNTTHRSESETTEVFRGNLNQEASQRTQRTMARPFG